jgi:RHS repeat-associated protein
MVSVSGAVTASFLYDGDGKRVMSTIGASTTYFVGNIYEVANGVVTKYYYAGGQRIALRSAGVVSYLLGDHLGSTSITTDAAGLVSSEQRYTAWGEVRYSSGSAGTKYTYTGQYSDSYINLLWYGSRHYDPALGRFISPDTIVPVATQATQAYDRYGYVNNNPLRYNDPTGHCIFGLDTAVCIVAAVFIIGAVMLAGDTTHSRAGDAENFYDLIGAGLSHDKHANIVGAGLESLQDDPSVQAAQKRIVNRITSNIEYEEQAFSLKVITDPNGFTANGPSGNWKQAAVTLNPAFWMVHTGQISATNIKVSADGTILTTWHIHDAFDFIPGPDHTEEYNKLASIIHPIYNGFFHAEETYPTDAYWKQTILPANSCGRCR